MGVQARTIRDMTAASAGYDRRALENHWTLSTTAMTPEEAQSAAQLLSERFPQVDVDPVDPRLWMTLHMDSPTVVTIRNALRLAASAGADVGGLLDDCEEFLSMAAPVVEGG